MRYFLLILLVVCKLGVFAQEYNRAIVTDLNYVLRYSSNADTSGFPFYFYQKDFIRDVQSEIINQLVSKFNVDEVLFFTPDSINYFYSNSVPPTHAKSYARVLDHKTTLFVSVETILQENIFTEGNIEYKFITNVEVYNYKGRKVHKHKVTIPFVSVIGDEVGGKVIMADIDFYSFYFDGLSLAFEGKTSKTQMRYVPRPLAKKYEPFVQRTAKFYLETRNDGYYYGKDPNKLQKVFGFDEDYITKESNYSFNFIKLVTRQALEDGTVFHNLFNKTKYELKLFGGVESLRTKYDPLAFIEWQYNESGKEKIYRLSFDKKSDLHGEINGNEMTLDWQDEYGCLVFNWNDEQIALINYFDTSKVLYISTTIDQNQLIAFFNSLFIYDYSLVMRNYMVGQYQSVGN